MSIVTMTAEGIQRKGVERDSRFVAARAALIDIGCKPTVWMDYLSFEGKDSTRYFVTIRKTSFVVTTSAAFHKTTTSMKVLLDFINDAKC